MADHDTEMIPIMIGKSSRQFFSPPINECVYKIRDIPQPTVSMKNTILLKKKTRAFVSIVRRRVSIKNAMKNSASHKMCLQYHRDFHLDDALYRIFRPSRRKEHRDKRGIDPKFSGFLIKIWH